MFEMMGAVAPVDKNSFEIICALQLLRMDKDKATDALRTISSAERTKIMNSIPGLGPQSAALKEHNEIFARKQADIDRAFTEKQRKVYIKGSGKYSKIVLAKR